jgi:hypothetical protein
MGIKNNLEVLMEEENKQQRIIGCPAIQEW